MEGQKRNTAQLVRIRATVDQRWGLKEDLQSSNEKIEKEDREDEEESEESQEEVEEKTLLLVFCQNIGLVWFLQ